MAYIQQSKRGTDRITVCVCSRYLLRSLTLGTADENSAELSKLVADAELIKAHLDSRFTKHQETLFATVLPDRLASLVEPLVKPYPQPVEHPAQPAQTAQKELSQQDDDSPTNTADPALDTAETVPAPDLSRWWLLPVSWCFSFCGVLKSAGFCTTSYKNTSLVKSGSPCWLVLVGIRRSGFVWCQLGR